MPHVSAVITNLAQELTLVDRMQDALSGEMVRRQELLREAGNYASIRDYEKARAAGEPLAPLPSLLSSWSTSSPRCSPAKPEFIDLFVSIGRLGRSLGLHLLLASQRLEEGRLRGLESHLSYRIGLRTFSRRRVARPCSACPTPTSCRRSPASATSSPTSRRCCGSRRRTSPGRRRRPARVRRDEGGAARHPAVHHRRGAAARADRGRGRRAASPPAEEQRRAGALLDVAVDRMVGQGRPRTRCGCRRSTCPTPSTS